MGCLTDTAILFVFVASVSRLRSDGRCSRYLGDLQPAAGVATWSKLILRYVAGRHLAHGSIGYRRTLQLHAVDNFPGW